MQGKLMQERGLHKAEIDGLEARIADLETAVSQKEQELSTLKSAPHPSGSKIDLGQFMTPEEIERIGEDEATTIVAAAQKAVEQAIAKLVPAAAQAPPPGAAKPSDRATRDAERNAREARQQFIDDLLELVPDYETIDVSPQWHAWLAEKKGPRGQQRQAVLDAHIRVGDAQAVAGMFEDFRKAVAPPPAPVAPHGDGGPHEDNPPRGPGALMNAPSEKEIRDYYKRAALGRVTDAERATFEARMKLVATAR